MQKEIDTPRLKLILVDESSLKDGSKYLESAHAVLGCPGATVWNIRGVSKSLEETQQRMLTAINPADASNRYRASYLVHIKKTDEEVSDGHPEEGTLQSIGIVNIYKCATYGTPFSNDLTLDPEIAERDAILSLELGYMFTPQSWGKGYCAEAVQALLKAYKENTAFWKPYRGVFLYIVIGTANSRSVKIPAKLGIKRRGVHRWDGEDIFLGGAMQPPEVQVFGDYLVRPN